MSVASSDESRARDLLHFYRLLDKLNEHCGGTKLLRDCTGKNTWPTGGVYFFFEPSESRSQSAFGLRVVRVGTHALTAQSKTTLWNRLRQHRGDLKNRSGNHRGSIFRLLIGDALMRRDSANHQTWGLGQTATSNVRAGERQLEQTVSQFIGQMPFLWLAIEDEAGPESLRGYIERNSIALLSNSQKSQIDPPSENWLGRFSSHRKVLASGLWNQNHVDEKYNPSFLEVMERCVADLRRE